MRKWLLLLCLLLLLPSARGIAEQAEETIPAEPMESSAAPATTDEAALPPLEYAQFTHRAYRSYDSETLKYKIETFKIKGRRCFLVKLWMQDPGKQIKKATAEWKRNIQLPSAMAKKVEGAALVINGSGYVSPTYPWIPENYPGTGKDYYYTPLGSVTVTDGEVYRNLEGVPYYGLTLEEDGLHMYAGEENEKVLARSPTQTWSFYVQCPMQLDGEVLTPQDWDFAGRRARRTVIGKVDRNNYLILSVTNEGGDGLTLHEVNDFFLKYFETEWVYNLDGGPSTALLARKAGKKKLTAIAGGAAKDADIMAFVELTAAEQIGE
ncbi:MAG: phosphodiester glycosidase family protein [Clostridia bacterium]|nr:phosphodiester glycosidase family protein [Clostridia bacterium]